VHVDERNRIVAPTLSALGGGSERAS
jgi:hypothetical protein